VSFRHIEMEIGVNSQDPLWPVALTLAELTVVLLSSGALLHIVIQLWGIDHFAKVVGPIVVELKAETLHRAHRRSLRPGADQRVH